MGDILDIVRLSRIDNFILTNGIMMQLYKPYVEKAITIDKFVSRVAEIIQVSQTELNLKLKALLVKCKRVYKFAQGKRGDYKCNYLLETFDMPLSGSS